MVQNIIVAGVARDPRVFGIHVKHVEEVKGNKAMHVLMKKEEIYPRVGASLVRVFSPGRLQESEQAFWDSKRMEVRDEHGRPRFSGTQDPSVSPVGPHGSNPTRKQTMLGVSPC